MKEIFKPVKGYEGRYEVSNLGRLISINGRNKGRALISGCSDFAGYTALTLRRPGIKRLCTRMHVLVAEHFLLKPENADCVNHIDGDKVNNVVTNLEWATFLENSQHAVRTGLLDMAGEKHPAAKLSEIDILNIRGLYHTKLQKEIAQLYGMSRRHICDIVHGVVWSHLPLEDYSKREVKFKRPCKRSVPEDLFQRIVLIKNETGKSIRSLAMQFGISYPALYGKYCRDIKQAS